MAEIGGGLPPVKDTEEWQQPQEAGRGKKSAPPESSERAQPHRHSEFGFLASRTVNLGHPVGGSSLGQPGEANTYGILKLTLFQHFLCCCVLF